MTLTTTYQKIATGSSKSYNGVTGYLELWAKYDSQSIENNKSNVSVELCLVVTGGYIGNYQATYWSISGDLANNGNLGSASYTSRTLGTATGDITHNSDGTKSVTFSGSFNPTAWNSGGGSAYTLTVTGSADLPTIPRSSSITSITGGTLGQTITVAISRASSSFTHNVYCKLGSRTQTLSSSATTSASATLDMNFANGITSGTTQTATMYVETYNGNTLIGTTTSNFTMTVPSSVVPTISSVTKSDTASLATTYGGYVQGKSNLRIQTSASGAYSSSISSCTVKLKSGSSVLRTLTGTDVTVSGISYTGTITIEVFVTDSRGRSSTTNSSTISVLAYSNPNITLFTAERLNDDSTVTLKWNASITALNNNNSKNFKIQYRQKGTTTWNDLTSTYTSAYTYSNNGYTTTKDDNYGWEFRLIAWDNFVTSSNPSSKEAEVGTAFELMNFGSNGKSIGFGQVATGTNTFECDLIPSFSKDATFSENVSVGGKLVIPKSDSITTTGLFNDAGQILFQSYVNNNAILNAGGGGLYLGYQNTTYLDLLRNKATLDNSGNFATIGNITSDSVNITAIAKKLGTIQQLGSSDDLNDKKDVLGFYYCNGSLNRPAANGYLMIQSVGSSYVQQFYQVYNASALYTRVCTNGTWNAWKRIPYSSELPNAGIETNGTYIKFPNISYQICMVKKEFTLSSNTTTLGTSGSVYYKTESWTFPVAFTSAPFVIATSLDRDTGVYGATVEPPTTTAVNITAYGPASGRAAGYYAIAIGPYA